MGRSGQEDTRGERIRIRWQEAVIRLLSLPGSRNRKEEEGEHAPDEKAFLEFLVCLLKYLPRGFPPSPLPVSSRGLRCVRAFK